MIPGDDEERPLERAQERRRPRLLGGPVPVGQVAGGDDELGLRLVDERAEIGLHLRLLPRARVQVGHVQHAKGWHRAGRL